MKSIAALGILFVWLMAGQTIAQQGLKGEYYTGTNFDRKVFTRIDPQLNFNWRDRSPAPGLPESYYSIRWTGKLLAPATGQYTFSARVDDGIRIWIGNQKIMDSWQLNDSKGIVVSVGLMAGQYYDLRVDYFNDMLEGEIELYWQRPNQKNPISGEFTVPREPVAAHYLFQKAPVVVVPKKLTKPVATTLIAVSATPKAVPQKRPVSPKANPRLNPPVPKPTTDTNTVTVAPVKPAPAPATESKPELTKGATFILRNVQFEQSSYVLLPESSAELDNVVRAMNANPQWHIDVAGHTDNVGDPRLNLALSENRAKVVAAYLKRHGIADERITATGFGGTRPIADNTVETERRKNRRVEITIK